MEQLPEPWRTAAEQAGIRQTFRGIGDEAKLSHVTVRRLIAEGRTSPATIAKVADALKVDESTVHEWAGVEVSEWGVWIPPRDAHKMPPRARAAVEELIRVLAEGASWSGTRRPEERSPRVTPGPDAEGVAVSPPPPPAPNQQSRPGGPDRRRHQ